MAADYEDPRLSADVDGLRIRHYYLPWGDKKVAYGSIRSIARVEVDALRGRWRIWGTSNPRYWANLDPGRPRKQKGFVLDLGHGVRPFLTPDDPDAFEAALRGRTDAPIEDADGPLFV